MDDRHTNPIKRGGVSRSQRGRCSPPIGTAIRSCLDHTPRAHRGFRTCHGPCTLCKSPTINNNKRKSPLQSHYICAETESGPRCPHPTCLSHTPPPTPSPTVHPFTFLLLLFLVFVPLYTYTQVRPFPSHQSPPVSHSTRPPPPLPKPLRQFLYIYIQVCVYTHVYIILLCSILYIMSLHYRPVTYRNL